MDASSTQNAANAAHAILAKAYDDWRIAVVVYDRSSFDGSQPLYTLENGVSKTGDDLDTSRFAVLCKSIAQASAFVWMPEIFHNIRKGALLEEKKSFNLDKNGYFARVL